MLVKRVDDVIRGERLAVVEFHSLTQLEGPLGSIVRTLPLLCQVRHRVQVPVQICEPVINLVGPVGICSGEHFSRVESLRLGGFLSGDHDLSTALWCRRVGGPAEQG